ncbi:hypothetical protein U9M48_000587 [Paspalum notatum var. saurae]|uniref:Uncharacterized protein n=1 Tax=Paspalum notatum var. saurae TaxID=547442 RepID=A0AAQ3PE46_PASNO
MRSASPFPGQTPPRGASSAAGRREPAEKRRKADRERRIPTSSHPCAKPVLPARKADAAVRKTTARARKPAAIACNPKEGCAPPQPGVEAGDMEAVPALGHHAQHLAVHVLTEAAEMERWPELEAVVPASEIGKLRRRPSSSRRAAP